MPLSSARRFSGVFQGSGRRWPKKKPSGSDSEEEEQVGQGLPSLGFPGACGPSLSGFLDSPLGVSKVRLATAEESAAREVILSCEEVRFQPSLGSGPSSPGPNGSEMPISEPPRPCARGGPGLRAASRPAPGCAVRATAAASPPQGPPPPSTGGDRVPRPGASRRCSPAGWVQEAFGTRGESCGAPMLASGGCGGRAGRCWSG